MIKYSFKFFLLFSLVGCLAENRDVNLYGCLWKLPQNYEVVRSDISQLQAMSNSGNISIYFKKKTKNSYKDLVLEVQRKTGYTFNIETKELTNDLIVNHLVYDEAGKNNKQKLFLEDVYLLYSKKYDVGVVQTVGIDPEQLLVSCE